MLFATGFLLILLILNSLSLFSSLKARIDILFLPCDDCVHIVLFSENYSMGYQHSDRSGVAAGARYLRNVK